MSSRNRRTRLHDHLSEVLFDEDQIHQRVTQLGRQIDADYHEIGDLAMIAIINGAIPFLADLIRQIDLPFRLDTVRVRSYRDSTRPVTEPEVMDTLRLDLRQSNVLLIDDILDTGNTISQVSRYLQREKEPRSVRTCVLLDKKSRRTVPFEADYVGFDIPDAFVVGYGLDFAECYRNLPCIGVLKPDYQNPPEWNNGT